MDPATDHLGVATVQEDHQVVVLVAMDHLVGMDMGLLEVAMVPLEVAMGHPREVATIGTDHVEEGVEVTVHREDMDQVEATLEVVALLVVATDHLEVVMVHPTMVDLSLIHI